MATRKSRQNTESPTPLANESTPTTPTTPATRNTRSIRNKQLLQGKSDEANVTVKSEKIDEDEEAVKDIQNNDDGDKEKNESKDNESSERDTDPPSASTRKRRIAMNIKEEPSTPSTDAASSIDDGKVSPNKLKRSRRSAIELLTGKPEDSPSIVSTRRNSTGKIGRPTRKFSSRIKKLKKSQKTTMRRSLLKKSDRLAATVTTPQKQVPDKLPALRASKAEKNESASDTEVLRSRRRSDSVSKCSDMTDASSFQEAKDILEEASAASVADTNESSLEIKQEALDKEEAQSSQADNEQTDNDMLHASTTGNDSGTGGESDAKTDIDDSKLPRLLRRGKRPNLPMKVMNTRSRSQTPCKSTEDDEDRSAASTKEIKAELLDTPLHVDTATPESNADDTIDDAKTDNADDSETVKSLSPVLVSEGVSEISVKQFYGQADFLENNLGIEDDPKLGEIVQEQEKMKEARLASDKQSTVTETTEITDCEQMETDVADQHDDSNEKEVVDEEQEDEEEEEEEVQEINTSTESVENDKDIDGAKCDNTEPMAASEETDCFVKPSEVVRKNSTTILNENLLVLNGVEIEFTKKENKKEVKKIEEDDVGEVVLYAISSNGKLMNPEKLETVLEIQRCKKKERSSSAESNEAKVTVPETNGIHVPETNQEQTSSGKDEGDEDAQSEAVLKALKLIDEEKDALEQANQENDSNVVQGDASNGPASSANSIGSRSSSIDDESPEERVQKESHLKTLGLLTHQAAVEATIEKQKQREKIKASISSAGHGKGKKNAEYTGTLKTVIKLHRGNNNDKKKTNNQSLKITLQKGRGKNGSDKGDANTQNDDDTYYTIQQQDADGMDLLAEEAAKESEKLLVIPEKASSFRYHPEKICEDQCFYCGGKFGLFDTPCHIAQIKSADRQKKILEYEEKLTVDSCLCDACFRHVDRRANCPSYKKRLSEPNKSGEMDDSKETDGTLFRSNRELTWCQVLNCKEQASQSVCSKWALKMRRTLTKHIQLNFDNIGSSAFVPICDKHYDDINQLLVCILCNRRLKRNNCYFINQEVSKIESLVANDGIAINVGITSIGCKLCRYYINMLMKPQEGKKGDFLKEHRKRLSEYHKIGFVDDDSDLSPNDLDQPHAKRAKRSRKSGHDISATNSDDGSSRSMLKSSEGLDTSAARTRQKAKQSSQQQLLVEQQRVEQRVQQEQMKQRQLELLKQQQQERSSREDITNLRTNPNISMRELFPGEEEMGLNVNVPFANSWRTPDGWMKVTSTVQYDEPTRRLWEDLQKPYGNQSSFLRHLLLLEKYFRNGDLLLAPNANSSANIYAESVQHRLQAFDNIPQRPVSISQMIPQTTITPANRSTTAAELTAALNATAANKSLTISKAPTPSKPAAPPALTITPSQKTADNSNSLLKSNASQVLRGRGYTLTTEPINSDKTAATPNKAEQPKATAGTNNPGSTSTPKNKGPGVPPELICITTPSGDKQNASGLLPSYQLQMQLTLQQQIQQQHQNSLLLSQQQKQMLQSVPQSANIPSSGTTSNTSPPKKQSTSSGTNKSPGSAVPGSKANIIRLPDTLTEEERRESKTWRPTLMPITVEKSAAHKEYYQTADGRRLPYLVQVQSGGKPYMISIHDYNRMCILRRESLMRSPDKPSSKSPKSASATTATANTTNTKVISTVDIDKLLQRPQGASNNSSNTQISNKVQIPNKILEQNSLIPLNSKPNENQSAASDSLLKRNKNPSLLKSNAVTVSQQTKQSANVPKLPLSLANALAQSNVVSITSTPSISSLFAMNSGTPASTPPPPIQLIPNSLQPLTITNVTSQTSSSQQAQANVSALEALFKTTNQVTTTPTTMWQWAEALNKSNSNNSLATLSAIDNSASSILSKIPKSLTVIPQKRLSKNGDE